MEKSSYSNQASSFISSTIAVGSIIRIQCSNNPSPTQQQYKGCWGIIDHILESTTIIAVGSDLVEYPLCDLNLVENHSPILIQVCDRITRLWQIPNLPASVRHLLGTFYQQRLDFSEEDLDVLQAIERLCHVESGAS
jgi:hypothetical protein